MGKDVGDEDGEWTPLEQITAQELAENTFSGDVARLEDGSVWDPEGQHEMGWSAAAAGGKRGDNLLPDDPADDEGEEEEEEEGTPLRIDSAEEAAFAEFVSASVKDSPVPLTTTKRDELREAWDNTLTELQRRVYHEMAEENVMNEQIEELRLAVEEQTREEEAFERIFPSLQAKGSNRIKPLFSLASECSVKGRRPRHEDCHVFGAVRAAGRRVNISYAAVMDGHGGSNCSRTLATAFESIVEQIDVPKGKIYPEMMASILRDHFREKIKQISSEFMTQGSTLCACFGIQNNIYFLNLGDSVAAWTMQSGESWYKLIDEWLDREWYEKALQEDNIRPEDQWMRFRSGGKKKLEGMEAVKTTRIHTPKVDRARIEHDGGFIAFGRLNGNLALARSVGDAWCDAIGGEPEVYWVNRRALGSPYIMLMCDGLFEPYTFWMEPTLEPAEAVKSIYSRYSRAFYREDIARNIAEDAFRANSHDNLSVMLLRLPQDLRSSEPSDKFSLEQIQQLSENDEFIDINFDQQDTSSGNM
eukprot:jgi/Bigna1/86131/estExt_fgenesh1_pg.C_80150